MWLADNIPESMLKRGIVIGAGLLLIGLVDVLDGPVA
jgi:hypothetical protein